GVIASLGTRPRRILAMVLLEAVLQGALGFAFGLALAWALVKGFGTIDISGLAANTDVLGARLPDVLRLAIDPRSVATAFAITLLTMLAAGPIPPPPPPPAQPGDATRDRRAAPRPPPP